MSKVKKFRDIEEDFVDDLDELVQERQDNNPNFERLVREAEKRRQKERKNKRKEKRGYLDDEGY